MNGRYTPFPIDWIIDANISPSGDKIAWMLLVPGSAEKPGSPWRADHAELWTADFDGGNPRRLTLISAQPTVADVSRVAPDVPFDLRWISGQTAIGFCWQRKLWYAPNR